MLWQAVLLPALAGAFLLWRARARPRSFQSWKVVAGSVAASAGTAVLLYAPVVVLSLDHENYLRKVRAEALKDTVDRQRLAEECISLLKNPALSGASLSPGSGQLPGLLESLRPIFVDIDSDSARVYILVVGGFDPEDHEAYLLYRQGNVYVLEWVGDYGREEPLLKLPVK